MESLESSIELINRMAKKGGSFHGSMRNGCVVHVKGEEPVTLVEPMSDEDYKLMMSRHVRPDVIIMGCDDE